MVGGNEIIIGTRFGINGCGIPKGGSGNEIGVDVVDGVEVIGIGGDGVSGNTVLPSPFSGCVDVVVDIGIAEGTTGTGAGTSIVPTTKFGKFCPPPKLVDPIILSINSEAFIIQIRPNSQYKRDNV